MSSGRWLVAVDKESNELYYFHEHSLQTSWTLPPGIKPAGLAVAEGAAAVAEDDYVDDDSGAEPIVAREGFLFKAPAAAGKWRKRWLVADRVTRTLSWYAANPRLSMARLGVSEPLKGTLSLVGSTICRSRGDLPPGTSVAPANPHPYEMFVVTPSRVLHLCGPSSHEIEGWVTYLEEATRGSAPGGAPPSRTAVAAARAGGPRATLASAARTESIVPRRLAAPVSVSAWLHKCAPDGHKWDERFAKLTPASLTFAYYTGEEDGARCCRVIDLRSATLLPGCANPADPAADSTLRRSPGFRLVIHGMGDGPGGERQMVFVTPDRREAQTWVDAIHTAQEAGGASRGTRVDLSSGRGRASSPGPAASAAAAASTPTPPPSAPILPPDDGPPPPLLSEIPVLELSVFKGNKSGSAWKTRTLVLVADASKASFAAPGVPPSACPCVAYYAPGNRATPRGVLQLEQVTDVVIGAPDSVRRAAPAPYTLTVKTSTGRAFFLASKEASDIERLRDAIFEVAEAWNAE